GAAEPGLRPEVVALPLLRVAQHVVRVRHLLEALGGLVARIDIRMQFPREPAVRLLDVLLTRVAIDPEYLVVVCQVRSSSPSSRVRYRATARTAAMLFE